MHGYAAVDLDDISVYFNRTALRLRLREILVLKREISPLASCLFTCSKPLLNFVFYFVDSPQRRVCIVVCIDRIFILYHQTGLLLINLFLFKALILR